MQVGERRIPGSEIVDREAHPELLQAHEALEIRVGVVHDRALGELDDEIARLEPGLVQRLSDIALQLAVLQVASGDVHREPQPVPPGDRGAPGAEFPAGLAQHPAPELDDLPAFLRHLDEARGHQHARLRMPPANQGLDPEEAARAEVDDRLILDEELLVGERPADVRLEPHALVQHILHLRLKGDMAVLARRLGVVHGDVRLAEQRLGARVRNGQRDADARRHPQLGAIELKWQLERVDQRVGQMLHLGGRRDPLYQNRKLVATEPRHRVRGARGLHDALRDRLQQPVACVMAERIVDVLEVVEVEEHDRDRAVAALGEGHRVLHPIAEQVAIGEQRQGIVERELPQLLLERLALADVAEIERQPLDRRILREIAADALDHAALVLALNAQLDRPHGARGHRGDFVQEHAQSLAVLPAPELGKVPAGDLLGPEAERALGGGRGKAHDPVRGDDHDDVGGVGDQRCVTLFDQARRAALAHQGVAPQQHALPRHEEQHQAEDDHGHDGRGAGEGAAAEVRQHQEGGQHRGKGERPCQGVGRVRHGAQRHRGAAYLGAAGGGERQIAAEVEHVLQVARQIVAAHLGERPEDVGEEHRGKTAEQQHRHSPAAFAARAREQHHPEHQQQNAVEGEVGLAQRFLQQAQLDVRGRRVDHQEPEERAEADGEYRGIERQLDPRHAHGSGADHVERRGPERQIEGAEEEIGGTRKRIATLQPRDRADHNTDEIKTQREGKPEPRAS